VVSTTTEQHAAVPPHHGHDKLGASQMTAFLLLFLGVLTLLATAVTVAFVPAIPLSDVPTCCRGRVNSFMRHAKWTVFVAGAAVLVGVVLLIG
jgi:hypothetical protein